MCYRFISLVLSVQYGLVTRKKRNAEKKIKIGIDVPYSTSKWNANFQFERSKVKVTGRKNLQNLASSVLTGGSAGGSSVASAYCTLGLRHC